MFTFVYFSSNIRREHTHKHTHALTHSHTHKHTHTHIHTHTNTHTHEHTHTHTRTHTHTHTHTHKTTETVQIRAVQHILHSTRFIWTKCARGHSVYKALPRLITSLFNDVRPKDPFILCARSRKQKICVGNAVHTHKHTQTQVAKVCMCVSVYVCTCVCMCVCRAWWKCRATRNPLMKITLTFRAIAQMIFQIMKFLTSVELRWCWKMQRTHCCTNTTGNCSRRTYDSNGANGDENLIQLCAPRERASFERLIVKNTLNALSLFAGVESKEARSRGAHSCTIGVEQVYEIY